MTVRLTVLGCGDAFSDGGRMTSAYLVEDRAGRLMLDFGLTALTSLQRAGIAPDSVETIVLSHLHGDHFGALPVLLLWREFHGDPAHPLTVIGPPGMPARLRALHEAMYPGSWRTAWRFPLELVELAPGEPMERGGRRITSLPVNHDAGAEPATGLRLETDGRVIAFSGDSGWCESLVALAEGADLFLCECNLWSGPGEGGHMSHERLAAELPRLSARRILLVHMGPEMLSHSGPLAAERAEDGMVIAL
ncbi:Ribonuclease BN, tRNA processing enzyme [Meinhardsimonia xiamenensis]|jgi:ribonuclease BN (tRNA processing enzyme)|uniref:Ribonuclease BN, tRNA processing enzyme n=1 Tax=Meinhardsimonia xiamenensis TaxID=990712 RepID=A0A1G9B7V2_9RHOB|nr:MBL fold metallo-hydrolase [Meinhardsimonia xiamenensis]PRX35107.1 ribonuclease BN (tRNA processing enzyme) [Meinhardsimonia xiamenensis]SDK34935.1 Ribonuclease BN, tRNA processing enzyme [Meinhardsimonia xiamenensis]